VLVGVLLARLTSDLVRGFLVGVNATDVATYAGTVAVIGLVALAACAAPAWRATKLDPLIALRQQ
jgi:putative ABC transport system permease protein